MRHGHGHVHAVPIDETPTRCPECGLDTRTLGALCEHCGAVKDPPHRDGRTDAAGLTWLLWYAPNLAFLAVAQFVLESGPLVAFGLALLLVPLLWQLLGSRD